MAIAWPQGQCAGGGAWPMLKGGGYGKEGLRGLVADFTLPFVWALVATAPALYVSWWVAYRSDWFG